MLSILSFPLRTGFTIGKTIFNNLPMGAKVGIVSVPVLVVIILLISSKKQ